jgi:hypothetical protein
MGMLPYAVRSLAELILWVGLVVFIMSRAAGIETTTMIELSNEKANNYLQALINSPSCFAYEKIELIERTNEDGDITGVEEEKIVKTGVVDITKFYDLRHQNCLRKAEPWDHPVTAGTGKKCGWSAWSYIGLDPNDDCPSGEMCVSNTCVINDCMTSSDCMEASEGQFIVYNFTLHDESTGHDYKVSSYEQGVKLVYEPVITHPEYADPKQGWAYNMYGEYLTCNTNFGGRIVKAETPVVIAYPGGEEHLGVLSVEMCIGTYGTPAVPIPSVVKRDVNIRRG